MLSKARILDGNNESEIDECVKALRAGSVIGIPTETVYGLAGFHSAGNLQIPKEPIVRSVRFPFLDHRRSNLYTFQPRFPAYDPGRRLHRNDSEKY